MKALITVFFVLYSMLLIAQPLQGIWHGKIYNNNGEAIKYINISIQEEGPNLIGIMRIYDKNEEQWVADRNGISEFVNISKNAILTNICEKNKYTESNVFLFSYITSKRMAVEWVSQLNYSDSSRIVSSKKGTGFLEPFLNGKIYENLAIGGTSTNRVSIDRVEIAKEVTLITFSYHNTSFETVMISLAKPGNKGAYYITPPDRSKKYYIIDKDHIAFGPDNTIIVPNSYHTFKIYFEAIPESLKTFSILEGDPELQSGKEWNFYDIQLK